MNFTELIKRMLFVGNLKNHSRLAEKLNVTPQAISNYKKRSKMPSDLILKFGKLYGVSIDWLLSGQGNPFIASDPEERGARDMIPELNPTACNNEEETRI